MTGGRLRSRLAVHGRALVTGGLALGVFAIGWAGLHTGFYRDGQVIDTPTYQRYGDAIANTLVPYRDFGLEYPPAALPVFAMPAVLRPIEGDLSSYQRWFEAEMFVCGALSLVLMLVVLIRLDADPLRLRLALGLAAGAPLLIGPVILSRFDLWPATLTVCALAALIVDRNRLSAGVLGVGFAAKLYPAVLLPVALAWVWKRRGGREAAIDLAIFAAIALACFLPFLIIAPHGVWDALTRQTNRPLQIESLGAGVLLVVHAITGFAITMQPGYGSQNLVGSVADTLPIVQTTVQLMAIAGVWIWFARGPAEPDRLVRAWAAAVCAFVAFGKVLSPQFLIWLIPLIPLVRGRRGFWAGGLLAASLVLTQLWFPRHYWDLALRFAPVESWLVLARDLALVALLAVLVLPTRRNRFRSGQRPAVVS